MPVAMNNGVTIALDAMGGDYGPDVVVPAALRALEQDDALRVILVGDEAILKATLGHVNAAGHERLKVHHASQKVGMDEAPSSALRNMR